MLSCARECFEHVVEAIARSASQLGFKEVLLIGDNGGNQAPLRNVADRLNREWGESGALKAPVQGGRGGRTPGKRGNNR